MEHSPNHSRHLLQGLTRVMGFTLFFVLLAIVCLTAFALWSIKSCSVGAEQKGKVTLSPTQITKIQDIGQWEFLSVSDEELADTVRHGFFGDDELARIYYGTLRIGIDLREANEGWIRTDHDTVVVVLPPIKLLDEHFIDEAQTRAFYEEGSWSEADKAVLTRRAAARMRTRALSQANIRTAEQHAQTQMAGLLRAMGYEYTRISFQNHAAKERSFWKK